MKKFFTKRNIYIGLFAILYITVALVSLIHSFAFFGLANDSAMSIMLGTTFEIGQAAVLLSILTSRKDRSRVMPWCLMILLTAVQVLGNVYSSYKYLMTNSVADLRYFKEPIFIWTNLPDTQATVIITYIVGAILPIVALCMTSMVSNYLEDTAEDELENKLEDKSVETKLENNTEIEPEPDKDKEQKEEHEDIKEDVKEEHELVQEEESDNEPEPVQGEEPEPVQEPEPEPVQEPEPEPVHEPEVEQKQSKFLNL